MTIKEQPMNFHERLAQISFFNEHWILFSILLCLAIFICFIIVALGTYIKDESTMSLVCLIGIGGTIASVVLLLVLLVSTWTTHSNKNNMKYISYNMTGTVDDVSTSFSEDNQDITITSGINKYQILLPKTINIKKGDTLKVSSNGKIVTDDDNKKGYINNSSYSEGHKINVKLKQNSTWYNINAQVYDEFIF